jgi:hypothetical protein
MNEIGFDVELNPVIRGISRKYGAFLGSFLGMVLPHSILYATLAAFNLNVALGFFVGLRTMLALLQLKSLN